MANIGIIDFISFDMEHMEHSMEFKEILKQLPQSPGVYKMIDSLGNIIYVGKAKNLKNRVSQYFRNQKDRAPKVTEMIRHIHTLNYQVTDTELDAFIEECRLIKELKPRYNKLMKSSDKYLYLKVPSELYPKVTIVKERVDDGALYFGPFTSRHRVESTVEYLNSVYPIRKCTSPGLVKRVNGCLFSQLGTCLEVCTGQISPEEYMIHIEKIRRVLSGNDLAVVRELLEKINSAIENLKFEQAAKYQEYYLGLQHVIGKQTLVKSSLKNKNTVAIEFIRTKIPKLYLFKGNRLIYEEIMNIANGDGNELKKFIKQVICNKFLTENNTICELSPSDVDEAQIIYSYLKNSKKIISFTIPSGYLKGETSRLDALVNRIADRIFSNGLR